MTVGPALRWVARTLSAAVMMLLALEVFGDHSPAGPSRAEMVGLTFFPGALGLGFLVSWWREALGALISTIGLLGFYVWSVAHSGHLPRGPWFVVVWSPAALFFLTAITLRRHQQPPLPSP